MSNQYGLTARNFLLSLPLVLQEDANMQAIATAIADVLERRTEEIERLRIFPDIESLPEELLDVLAADFCIDWYNYDYHIEAKRRLVKTSWDVHRHLGTTQAVRTAIQSVYPNADVEEWWQERYGGEPYHFRVVLDAGTGIVPADEVLRAIKTYQSYRSELDGIAFRSFTKIAIQTACRWLIYTGRFCGTYPYEAQRGELVDDAIVVQTDGGRVIYRNPTTGEIKTGTFPKISQCGEIADGSIVLQTSDGGVVYQNPATGEIQAGTFPETAVSGSAQSSVIAASFNGQGAAYRVVRCGSGLKF